MRGLSSKHVCLDNPGAMATRAHLPKLPPGDNIRILELVEHEQWSMPYSSTAVCPPKQSNDKYAAVSYAWGPPPEASSPVPAHASTYSFSDHTEPTVTDSIRKKFSHGSHKDHLAIVGMAGRFPDTASHEKLWELLEKGLDVHREVPKDRFNAKNHYDSTSKIKTTSHTPYGNWIETPGLFDPRFFNMSPREAFQTDPMQRMALSAAYEALEMSGIDSARENTRVQKDRQLDDYRQKLTQSPAYAFRKTPSPVSQGKPTWARAEVTKDRLTQDDVKTKIQKLDYMDDFSLSDKSRILTLAAVGFLSANSIIGHTIYTPALSIGILTGLWYSVMCCMAVCLREMEAYIPIDSTYSLLVPVLKIGTICCCLTSALALGTGGPLFLTFWGLLVTAWVTSSWIDVMCIEKFNMTGQRGADAMDTMFRRLLSAGILPTLLAISLRFLINDILNMIGDPFNFLWQLAYLWESRAGGISSGKLQLSRLESFVFGNKQQSMGGNSSHILIQCPVYKPSLAVVIVPTVVSLKAAIASYESSGGSASIFVNDDGMKMLRDSFYDSEKDLMEKTPDTSLSASEDLFSQLENDHDHDQASKKYPSMSPLVSKLSSVFGNRLRNWHSRARIGSRLGSMFKLSFRI